MPYQRRIVIAGIGLITPLEHTSWATFRALLAGRSIADRTTQLPDDVAPVDLVRAIGTVSVTPHAGDDPSVELAERAAREAATEAGVSLHGVPGFLGTSKGAVHALTAAAEDVLNNRQRTEPLAVAMGPHGYLAHRLRQRLQLGPVKQWVAACASSLAALDAARRHLQQLPPDAPSPHALVFTAEAALTPLFIHSYRRLGVLASLSPTGYRQRPLDDQRRGFMLTEAGAALLLRALPAGESPQPGEIELVDTATAAEADDMIRPAPQMAALRHLARSLFAGRRIDVIHPHATGTAEHDPAELAAYHQTLTDLHYEVEPDFYACKGALGHALGAAGLTALTLACLCLKTGNRPPMPWLDAPIEPAIKSEMQTCSRAGTHAVFAAGFGSHVAGAVVKRHG